MRAGLVPIGMADAPGGAVEARILDLIYEPVRDGAVTGIAVQGQDATEGAKGRRGRAGKRFRAITKTGTDDATPTTDPDGRIVIWRRAASERDLRLMTGMPKPAERARALAKRPRHPMRRPGGATVATPG